MVTHEMYIKSVFSLTTLFWHLKCDTCDVRRKCACRPIVYLGLVKRPESRVMETTLREPSEENEKERIIHDYGELDDLFKYDNSEKKSSFQ